jgi:hypothetical protein
LPRVEHGSRLARLTMEEKHGSLTQISGQMKRGKLLNLHRRNSKRTDSEPDTVLIFWLACRYDAILIEIIALSI